MQAKEISDQAFLDAIQQVMDLRGLHNIGASRWDIAAILAGCQEDVGMEVRDYPHMPRKVVLAKARKLVRRGLIDGCACGCRGDFRPKLKVGPRDVDLP